MKTRLIVICCTIFLCANSFAQYEQYATFLIPDSLKVNANSVVRKNVLEVTVINQTKQKVKESRVITIFNEDGNDNLDLYEVYDNHSKILNLSAIILDAQGNAFKKISKGKFSDVNAVSEGTFYSDDRIKFYNFTPTKYPITIVFESETINSSTVFINPWYPIYNFGTSIEKSVYKFNNPTGIKFRKRENNLKGLNIQDFSSEINLHYELENYPAIKHEDYSLPNFTIAPSVSVSLNNFSLKGIKGSADNWKDLGEWMCEKLIKGRDVLDEVTKSKIRGLVEGINSDKEKAKKVYDFVQKKTRYVGVQIGIGGWSPIPAKEVDKVGYGDCKGLTNYTKALLDAVGVKSYHTIVYANKKRDLDKNFASLEGNHMILNIPNDGEDLWLECTSQIHPFGFLGDFTDDRDVLVITPEGGIIKRTPAYINEDNSQETKADIIFNIDGSLTANVIRTSKGTQYDDKFYIERESEEDVEKYYKSEVWGYNNNLEIQNIDLLNDEDNVSFTEKISLTIDDYIVEANEKYLLRVNAFNKFSSLPKRYRNRELPFEIERGFLDTDDFKFSLPENFSVEGLPIMKEIVTKFGTYKTSVEKLDDNNIRYKKYFFVKAGKYSSEEYSDYRVFLKRIVKQESLSITMRKK